jgi:hypothetical protein
MWSLIDPRGWSAMIPDLNTDRVTWFFPIMFFAFASALIFARRRGVVDPPLRIAAMGSSIALVVTTVVTDPTHPLSWANIAIHSILAGSWIITMLLSDSPYRPRTIQSMKRVRERS